MSILVGFDESGPVEIKPKDAKTPAGKVTADGTDAGLNGSEIGVSSAGG